MASREKVCMARKFRKNPTKSEDIFWNAVRDRKFMNLKFRRQYIVVGFIVDFYCSELRIAVEIDGKVHDKRKILDELRQDAIEMQGIKFVRFTNEEVENNLNKVLIKLTKSVTSMGSPSTRLVERGTGGEVLENL